MNKIKADLRRWCEVKSLPFSSGSFVRLFFAYAEFRTLFYYRLKQYGVAGKIAGRLLNSFFRGQTNCYLYTARIGGGRVYTARFRNDC